jgi:outer membrane protein TolC
LADVRRQTILQVKIAFTSALVARESLALAEQNLRTVDETERLQRLRAEKGYLSELELLRIQVQRFTFERDAADARQPLDRRAVHGQQPPVSGGILVPVLGGSTQGSTCLQPPIPS